MGKSKMEQVYDSLVRHVVEPYRLPGVENAFAVGAYCMNRYADALEAYERLCDRLGVMDEDDDVEIIFNAFMDIQEYLCYRMYCYGAKFGPDEK